MKLIIQIPCLNEAETIGVTLDALPRNLPGVDHIEWLIVDDGSTDGTVEAALAHGADHIVRLNGHQGLARAFTAGLDACISAGADIIVNTDADNQYNAADIPKLIEPILENRAEVVVGARPIEEIAHFSPVKKRLQLLGSWVVRLASKADVKDAPSGFRAMSREAAKRLHIFDKYTYTLETIIQAGQNGMRVVSVPIRTNPDLRPSRLIRSMPGYVLRSVATIGRIFITYRPLKSFSLLALIVFLAGFGIGARYLYFVATGEGGGHVQSVVLAAALLAIGAFIFMIGIVADLIATNRKLLEKVDWKLRNLEEAIAKREDAPARSGVGGGAKVTPISGAAFERPAEGTAERRK